MKAGLVALALLTVFAYAGVRSNGWVYEDMAMQVAADGAPDYSHGVMNRNLVRWTVYETGRMFGPGPEPQHVVQLLGHLINGALLFTLASALLPEVWALLAVAIFLLHPIQVETAAYVASRPDLLMTMGLLTAATLAIKPWGWVRGAGIFAGAMLAIFAKQTGIVVLPLLILIAWWKEPQEREGWAWGGLAMVGAIADIARRVPADLDALPYTWLTRPLYQSAAFWNQVRLVVLPVGFTIDHDIAVTPFWLATVCGALSVAVGIWALSVLWRGERHPGGWLALWALLQVAPRFVLQAPEYFNSHQFYPAMPAIAMGLALGARALWVRRPVAVSDDCRDVCCG